MAELTGEPIGAIDHLTVDDDTRADACAECNHDEIFHATGCAVCHFAESGRVGIVCDSNWDTEFFADKFGEID